MDTIPMQRSSGYVLMEEKNDSSFEQCHLESVRWLTSLFVRLYSQRFGLAAHSWWFDLLAVLDEFSIPSAMPLTVPLSFVVLKEAITLTSE